MNNQHRGGLRLPAASWRMGLGLLLLGVLVLVPLSMVLLHSLFPDGVFDALAPLRVLSDPGLLGIFWNSIALGGWVVMGSTLLALPMAFLAARTTVGRHAWLDVVLIIPFMTPPYIGSMGWILFMQRRGFAEQLLPAAAGVTPAFFSLFGMVAIMSLHLFPFLYLILRNALVRIGGSLEEAAGVHGGGMLYRLRRVVLPLLVGSYAMGALLVFVKTIAEFGTPATFGRQIGYYVLTSEIHRFTSSWPIDFGKATALASVLLGACLMFWYVQSIISRRHQYRTLGGKGMRIRMLPLRGWRAILGWGYTVLLLCCSIGIPYFSIIAASMQKLRGDGLAWSNVTLAHYVELLRPGSKGWQALTNSMGLAALAATVAVLIGTFLVLQMGNMKRLSQRSLDLFSLLPNTVPGIVIVVGLILLWNAPWMPIPIYNTYTMVVLTYVVFFLPYSVQYIKSSAGQIDGSLVQAGRVFGGSPFYLFRRIVLPLLVPGILAGWMMTFTISARELVASLMVLPPSMQVTATFIFSQFEQGEVSLGMAMAVVSVGLTTLVLVVMNHLGADRK
ncbi:ABC transporter permease [Paenibacillus sp. 1P07SE]|uniref:ABC transporter permease n=1 Tax=Paenibacillus sp. 1P07SE TaxID=3132209 RepID=UPI0039A69D53